MTVVEGCAVTRRVLGVLEPGEESFDTGPRRVVRCPVLRPEQNRLVGVRALFGTPDDALGRAALSRCTTFRHIFSPELALAIDAAHEVQRTPKPVAAEPGGRRAARSRCPRCSRTGSHRAHRHWCDVRCPRRRTHDASSGQRHADARRARGRNAPRLAVPPRSVSGRCVSPAADRGDAATGRSTPPRSWTHSSGPHRPPARA